MDWEAVYAELDARKPLRDEWYHIGLTLFMRLLNDGKWEQENEYRFTRKVEGQKAITIDLRNDRVYGFGQGTVPRTDGLDYLVNELQANGGTLDGLWPSKKEKPAGPLRIIPPYRLDQLSKSEQNYHRNIPPEREQLQLVMRFDERIHRLYFVAPEGGGRYEEGITSAPAYFIPLAGRWFARWRIISQLLFDNPYGVENLAECRKVLVDMPEGPAAWKDFNGLINEWHAHMNVEGPNHRTMTRLRQTPAVVKLQDERDDAHKALIEAQKEVAALKKELALRKEHGNFYVDEQIRMEKEKASGLPVVKSIIRRRSRGYRT